MELRIKLSLAKENEENKKISANVTHGLLKTVKYLDWGQFVPVNGIGQNMISEENDTLPMNNY